MLAVSDDGVGLPASFDFARSESLGMQLIQTLAAQVSGEFTYSSGPNGSRFQLLFPARA
jgi:two-component sensor histidine kinase